MSQDILRAQLFSVVYIHGKRDMKKYSFVSGKIYWHTFCRFLCQNCLYSNAINHGNLFWEMYNFMCFLGSVNKFSFAVCIAKTVCFLLMNEYFDSLVLDINCSLSFKRHQSESITVRLQVDILWWSEW